MSVVYTEHSSLRNTETFIGLLHQSQVKKSKPAVYKIFYWNSALNNSTYLVQKVTGKPSETVLQERRQWQQDRVTSGGFTLKETRKCWHINYTNIM
jgi:hypothetical protein